MKENYYGVQDLMAITGLGKSKAYDLIKILNCELTKQGYLTIKGKVPREYANERLGIK